MTCKINTDFFFVVVSVSARYGDVCWCHLYFKVNYRKVDWSFDLLIDSWMDCGSRTRNGGREGGGTTKVRERRTVVGGAMEVHGIHMSATTLWNSTLTPNPSIHTPSFTFLSPLPPSSFPLLSLFSVSFSVGIWSLLLAVNQEKFNSSMAFVLYLNI